MQNYDLRYDESRYAVADAAPSARAAFVRRTYGHLAGAILGFIIVEAAIFSSGQAKPILEMMYQTPYSMLVLMLLFIGGGYAARAMARSATSDAVRYAGLTAYVLLQCVVFLPILYVANERYPGEYVPLQAGIVTMAAFAGLTFATVISGKNFSFLGPILSVLSLVALAVIVCALIFGAGGMLGTVFSAAMIVLACGYIIYDTSNVMHVYREDQHVAAALELFASVALLFYYILRIFLASRSD